MAASVTERMREITFVAQIHAVIDAHGSFLAGVIDRSIHGLILIFSLLAIKERHSTICMRPKQEAMCTLEPLKVFHYWFRSNKTL